MGYRTLQSCVADLRRTRQLIEFNEEVDPCLELAAVQRRLYAAGAPAVLFTKPKNYRFPMLANLYGTQKRIEYIFRDGIEPLRIAMKFAAELPPKIQIKNAWTLLKSLYYSRYKYNRSAFKSTPVLQNKITLDQLPHLISWQDDGGAYLTLPQVYTEHPVYHNPLHSNLGMYRVQISGNDYRLNEECGLHYQIQRGIALHHIIAQQQHQPLAVKIFIGGAPCMTLAAIMPLPENISEILFAGILGQHRIPITQRGSIYSEADFCIIGTIDSEEKKEGPFGDHLGYYSLSHKFPVMKINQVYHRNNAIFPFTVVGRPPQEDTEFGKFIHNIIGDVITKKLPGIEQVHAVDEAGVHPLLLAVGRETFPNELHTLAHSLLGSGQLALAKYLFIAAKHNNIPIDVRNIPQFFHYILERVDWRKDVHFITQTSMDTLDYTGGELNRGSKLFVSASGVPIRTLATSLPESLPAKNPRLALPGVLCAEEIDWNGTFPEEIPLVVLVDNVTESAASLRNFLWTTFTKSDPANDVRGIGEFIENKHWGCSGALVIDAYQKAHHAPELVELPEVAQRADKIAEKILK